MSFEIDRKYRTNPLSHTNGGATVFVKYPSGHVRSYKDVKNPWLYRKKALKENPELKIWYKKNEENKNSQ